MCTPPPASPFCSVRREEAQGAHDGHKERAGEKTREFYYYYYSTAESAFGAAAIEMPRDSLCTLVFGEDSGKYSQTRKWMSRGGRKGFGETHSVGLCCGLVNNQESACTFCGRGKYH